MSKAFTGEDFSNQIVRDRTWRLKEISDLKKAVEGADLKLQRVLLRSLVAICYAHWEGYVRFTAQKYLEHIAMRRLKFGELDRQFLRNYFLPRLAALSTSKASISDRCALIDEILGSSEKSYSRVNEDLVSTGGNLKFNVLVDICLVCNVPVEQFTDKESFIDVFLLKRRNSIAHGEDTYLGIEELDQLADNTIEMMRMFGNALDNSIQLKLYRAV